MISMIHRQQRIDRLLIGLPTCLVWLSGYVASHHLAVAPQSGEKDQFYSIFYHITLNSNCEAHRVSKKCKSCRRQGKKPKLILGDLSVFLKVKIMFKGHLITTKS